MQFRGHSLPVHQSMSVSWAFYLVLFHQSNPPTRSLSITGHWNVSLPSGVSPWNGMFARTEGQNTTLVQVRNFLLPLSLKVLWHKERDTHSFDSGFSICPPLTCAPTTRPLVWLRWASKSQPSSSEAGFNSTNWLFTNPAKSSAHASGAWRHSHPQVLSGIFILRSLNDTSPPPAPQHLCSSLHLTNPYAEPKGSESN